MSLNLEEIREQITAWQIRSGCDCALSVSVEPTAEGGAKVSVKHEPLCTVSLALERAALPLLPQFREEP